MAFRDKLPEATLDVYFSALCNRNKNDLSLAVTEIIATEQVNRVPNIATIKRHLSNIRMGHYCE